jgi:hypothetical protein
VDGSHFRGTLSDLTLPREDPMKKMLAALTLLGSVAAAPETNAQVAIDVKAGYALPLGDTYSGGDTLGGALKNRISAAVPIEVAGRWRFTPNLSAGIYFQYAPAFVASYICTSSYSCSAYDMRVGVQVAWALNPDGFLNPWISLGTGWEWTGLSITVPAPDAQAGKHSATLSGWEYVNVQVGGDLNVSRTFAVGPWVGVFAGAYSTRTDWTPTGGGSIPADQRTFHGWVQFGLKGTANL